MFGTGELVGLSAEKDHFAAPDFLDQSVVRFKEYGLWNLAVLSTIAHTLFWMAFESGESTHLGRQNRSWELWLRKGIPDEVALQDRPEMPFMDDDHVVQAFASNTAVLLRMQLCGVRSDNAGVGIACGGSNAT